MSGFTPGVARVQAAGQPVQVAEYPPGPQGIRLSLDVIAQKIRDGRNDVDVRGWAGDVLIAAGRPKTVKAKAQALLDAFRAQTMYLPDPVGTEQINSAAATLCLRPGLCVRARDCDDGCVALGSALLSIGIPCVVVKQNFGGGQQEHVLLECEDENGNWLSVDPSSETYPVGKSYPAVSEVRVDPMDKRSSSTGTSGAEIVTLGGPPRAVGLDQPRKLFFKDGMWIEYRYGTWWANINNKWVRGSRRAEGVGHAPRYEARGGRWWFATGDIDVELTSAQARSFGLGAAVPAATTPTSLNTPSVAPAFTPAVVALTNQVGGPILAADTYLGEGDYVGAVTAYQAAGVAGVTNTGPTIDAVGAANATRPFTKQAAGLNAQLQLLQEVGATQTIALQAQSLAYQIFGLYSQAIGAGSLAKGAGGTVGQTTVPQGSIPTGLIVFGAIGLGLAGGFAAWHTLRA
jgi:hypothetical protein